jgi:hypothetical protein
MNFLVNERVFAEVSNCKIGPFLSSSPPRGERIEVRGVERTYTNFISKWNKLAIN